MRLYAPIWDQLKRLPFNEAKSKGISITANRKLHKRIIKAVKKEKYMDVPFKLEKENQRWVLQHTQQGSILTFYLTLSITDISDKCL